MSTTTKSHQEVEDDELLSARIVDRSRLIQPTRSHITTTRTASYDVDIHRPKPYVADAQPETVPIIKAEPFAKPAKAKQQPSKVVARQFELPRNPSVKKHKTRRSRSKTQFALVAMAFIVFGLGLLVDIQTLQSNHNAKTQVAALSKKAESTSAPTDSSAPEETPPPAGVYKAYQVAPDEPRYIKIGKINVTARVKQVGLTSAGALDTPKNIYDAAWYTGSSKPGQPGATLIDGHVSGWTAHGVFYGLKKLVPGDTMTIEKGDGSTVEYRVVKTQTYSADNVDMKAAVQPVTLGKSGLNVITCTGKVKPGTSDFDHRIVVFAEEI